jgi:RNA polymerase sigma factor (TIGR02999 family)
LKNGANQPHFEIAVDDALVTAADADQLLDLDDALTRLADVEPELARLVELRFFIGLTIEQSAEILGVSPRTVKRNWSFARAWLGRELGAEKPR